MTLFGLPRRELANWRSGLALTLAALSGSALWRLAELREQYAQETASREIQLAGQVQQAGAATTALATLFSSADHVDADQLRLLAEESMQRWPFLRAALYAPRIPPEARAAYEVAVAEAGMPGFRMRGEAAEWYPLRYYEPFSPLSTRWLGWNLMADPQLAAIMNQATISGRTLVFSGAPPFGQAGEFWLLHALYSLRGRIEAEQRARHANGMVGFALSPAALIDGLARPGEGLRLTLLHMDSVQGFAKHGALPEAGLFGLRQHYEFPLADARLRIEFGRAVQPAEFLGKEAGAALILGLAGTLLFLVQAFHSSARHAAEVRYRTVADNTYAWETWIDGAGRWIYCSPACRRITGHSAEAFMADPGLFLAVIHPEDQPRMRAHLECIHEQSRAAETLVVRIQHRDGRTLWIEHLCQPVFDAQGRHLGRRASNRDVSDRILNEMRTDVLLRISQAASRLSERELLQMGLEEAERLTGSAIGYLHFINDDQETIRLYTWTRNTLNFCTAAHATHYPVAQAGIWADAVRLRRPVLHNDYQNMDGRRGYPEGHAHLLRHMAVPIIEGDRVRMILGVGNKPADYDEADLNQLQLIGDGLWKSVNLRHAMNDLEAARDAAETANRAKSVFLANMSHELRTPLNAILGFAQIMERDSRIPADERKNIATINRSGSHLLALINDVLEISRIEAGRTRVVSEAFDLDAALQAVEEMIRVRAEAKGLGFRVERHGELAAYVLGDAHHLRQVLINLLGNAVKYTDAGEVVLHLWPEDGQVRFAVTDTGPGIAPEDQNKIFMAFYQTEGGIAKGEGTGLGLTISAEFVRLMGGELSVQSELGAGSTFSFALPLPATDAVPYAGPGARITGLAPGQAAPRILVAEDHPDNQAVIEHLLRMVGCAVEIAADGQQAVEAFQARPPDLILMDMRMPVMDGYAATRAIRALPGGGKIPIIALTASAFEEDRQNILAAGCDELVRKPVEESTLFNTIGGLLGLAFEYGPPETTTAPASGFDLGRLPAELRQELAEAALLLDKAACLAIIERMRPDWPTEAACIAGLIEDYRFDHLAERLAKGET